MMIGIYNDTSGELLFIVNSLDGYDLDGHTTVEVPAGPYVWSAEERSFSIDLEPLKEAKWLELKAARDAAEWNGFDTELGRFDSDEKSQVKISGAVLVATITGEAFSIDWTLQDNTSITLNAAQMVATGLALMGWVDGVHQHSRALRDTLDAAETVEEIEALVWEF